MSIFDINLIAVSEFCNPMLNLLVCKNVLRVKRMENTTYPSGIHLYL